MIVVANGKNAKLGPGVGTTYRQVGPTCPSNCPLLNGGCYAQRGYVAIHAARADDDHSSLMRLAGNTLCRHLVSGDWLKTLKSGKKTLDKAFVQAVIKLHRLCPWLTGWGYTHAATEWNKAGIGPKDLPSNLHILASCDSAEEKAAHNANGWRTARVINEATERQADEFLCPVDAQKHKGVPAEKQTNCARCRACFATDKNIAFIKF